MRIPGAMVLVVVLVASFLVPVAGVAGAASPHAQASLTLSPAEGNAGSQVMATGQGFAAGAKVEIEFWAIVGTDVVDPGVSWTQWGVGTGTADGSGSVSIQFRVPYTHGGKHQVDAVVAGSPVASSEYVIKTTYSMSPTSGPEGTLITMRLTGGGWTHYENIVSFTYDNAFLGSSCSTISQGNITTWIQATGSAGPHVVGIYPAYWWSAAWEGPTPWKHPGLNPAEFPVRREIQLFTFTVTESKTPGRSYAKGAVSLGEVIAPDALSIAPQPAVPIEDGTPHLTVGNGGKGVVGGDVPYALTGLQPGASVEFRWNSYDVDMVVTGDLNKEFGGWSWTRINQTLGTGTTGAGGKLIGNLKIPAEFGGAHLLEAVVGGQVVANATFMVIMRFTATLNADGSQINLHATGLGSDKYSSIWVVLYDNHPGGWVSAFQSRGSADVSIPAVGTEGRHSIDIYEGTGAYAYLNMQESDWPWEPAFRFAFTIPGEKGGVTQAPEAGFPVTLMLGLILLAIIGGFIGGRLSSRSPRPEPVRKSGNGAKTNGTKKAAEKKEEE